MELFLPDDYPMSPPKVRFLTDLFHPNVDKLGACAPRPAALAACAIDFVRFPEACSAKARRRCHASKPLALCAAKGPTGRPFAF